MSLEALEARRTVAPDQPLRVLVADDDDDCRETMAEAVRFLGFSCETARDGAEAWEMFLANRADVILSDWKMPRMDGLNLCVKVRGDDPRRSYTHFIFVTGNDDKAHLIDGMRAGADDYIAKPEDLDELKARLTAAKRVVMLHRELQMRNSSLTRVSQQAQVAARIDPLTDAFNRLALKEDLETLLARAARYGHKYCAALCDIDHFKAYNDHFGHIPGDDAIRRVAHAIHGGLRRGDVFYRYGGEEFLVILPEQTLAEATLGMDRVRQEVERLQLPHAPAAAFSFVSISVGICSLSVAPPESIDGWLRRTDAALYVAKERGRNRVATGGEVD